MAEGNGRQFVVQMSGAVRDQVRDALEQAGSAGQHAAALRALRGIATKLNTNAAHAGEPIRYLAKARMTIRKLAVAPLYVEYAVHDTAPLVTLRRVTFMIGTSDE